MCPDAGILPPVNAVVYYSNTGNSLAVAGYVAKKLDWPLLELEKLDRFEFQSLVVVFPVHCQKIPTALLPIFKRLRAEKMVVLAAYGRMCHGNVLWECQRKFGWRMVGAAFVPTAHSYIPESPAFSRWAELDFVEESLACGRTVTVPRSYQNPLSHLFPGLRSRLGIRLVKGDGCTNCGLCRQVCRNQPCIRCLKCVARCPAGALSARPGIPMQWYLKKRPRDDLVIYRQASNL